MEFKTWIEVSFERMATLKALQLFDVFSTDPGAGRFRVVDQSQISFSTMQQWNKEQPTLAIVPTSRPLVSSHPDVHVVPYSDHSSYQELEDFVSALKPTSLVPILGKCVPESLSALLPAKRRHEILVPESVQRYMLRPTESRTNASACVSLQRRHPRSLAPTGVVFESPVKVLKGGEEAAGLQPERSEDEMDVESSDRESEDGVLIDMSKNVSPDKGRGGAGDSVTTESVPLHQHPRNNFAPGAILMNSQPCVKPPTIARTPFESNTERTKTVTNKNCCGRCECSENNDTSDDDGTNRRVGHGTDPDDADSDSCSSLSFLPEAQEERVQEIERSVLENLPFREEDVRPWGLLPQSFVQQFPLCPLYDAKHNNSRDK